MRRAYGSGTTYQDKKTGRWIAQLYVDAGDDKKKRVTGRGDTEAKAIRDRNAKVKLFEEKQKELKEQQKFNKVHSETLESFLERWLLNDCKANVKITTFENYCYFFYTHIKDSWLGKMPLDTISEADIKNYYNEKVEKGRNNGKGGLSVRSVNYLRFLIKGAFTRAFNTNLIQINPHAGIKKIKDNTGMTEEAEIHPLTPEEFERFKKVLLDSNNRLRYLILFAAGSGLRKGEISALTWDDFDEENRLLKVKKNLAFIKGCHVKAKTTDGKKALVTTPKTKASRRTIHLNDMLIACLNGQREMQEKEKAVYKELYDDKNLIFASETGDYLSPKKILREVKKIYKSADIPQTHTFHDLRHTFCSLMINKDINIKVISEIMGHSSITITLDIYSTLFDEAKAKAMKEMDTIWNLKAI
jgi:integrase